MGYGRRKAMGKEQTINMNREEVIDFIKRNIKQEKHFYEIEEGLIEVVLHIIPLLGHYEEEGRKINFSIAIGMNNNMKDLIANCYVLKTYTWIQENIEDRIKKIERMIKQVAVFCEKDANIFIVQNENKIECGIYIPKLNATEKAEDSFLNKNFIIFEHLYKNKVVANAKEDCLYICMDFDKEKVIGDISDAEELSQHLICRKWKGIFERVKRTVHGTICLFVDSNWNPCKGSNYTESIDAVDLQLKLKNNPSADEIQNFNNQLDMFMSMLNYDGITIIDTSEKIRAYNLFCKIKDDNKENTKGGARYRAYKNLKELDLENRVGYVAVYFQSQEGEIEFYKYDNQKVTNYFDTSIMKTNTALKKSEYENIKKKYDTIQKACIDEFVKVKKGDLSFYFDLYNCIKDLVEAHHGINNFYNEPGNAKKLEDFIENNKNQVTIILKNYTKMRIDLLSIVFQCIVGYNSGYSWNAQDYLERIINCIEEDIYVEYFENEEYLDTQLLWSISSSYLFERWNYILKSIKEKYPTIVDLIEKRTFTSQEYSDMYDALIYNDDI